MELRLHSIWVSQDWNLALFNTDHHPCFNPGARHMYARIHLPVAPRCNMQCNYCDRKYSCVNESRPGVTSAVLSPQQALSYTRAFAQSHPNLSVVGIAGPGDPFACPQETLTTMQLVREKLPDLLLCIASNGLAIGPYIKDVAEIGISHVTLTINAVDAKIGAKFYQWILLDGKRYEGEEAAALLWQHQREALLQLLERGIAVKVNSICVPGINEDHILDVARTLSKYGVQMQNVMALLPTAGTPFADIAEPGKELLAGIRKQASLHIQQMTHCSRCRADAAGLLGQSQTPEQVQALRESALISVDSIVSSPASIG